MASIYKIATGWRVQIRHKGRPTVSEIFPIKAHAQDSQRKGQVRVNFAMTMMAACYNMKRLVTLITLGVTPA